MPACTSRQNISYVATSVFLVTNQSFLPLDVEQKHSICLIHFRHFVIVKAQMPYITAILAFIPFIYSCPFGRYDVLMDIKSVR